MVEVDGPIHLSQGDYDADRDVVLASRGFRVLRITSEEVRSNMRGVLRRIAKAVEPAEGQRDRDANKLDAELKGR
jgi:very-short-patch-repair endonuclease